MALIDKASLLMVPSTYEAGTLYNVLPSGNRAPDSTDQNSGYDQTRADFTFDRGSNAAATRVNADGLIEKYRENLLLQSNQFDTTWSKTSGITLTSGQSGYDGGSDAWLLERTLTTGQRIWQSITKSGVQTFSVYAKNNNARWLFLFGISSSASPEQWFDLENGVLGTSSNLIDSSITDVGNGWYRCSMTFNKSITEVRIYNTNADNSTSGTIGHSIYIQNAQLESGLVSTDYLDSGATTAKAGVLIDLPRINYDANGENGSLLLEPQRQQLILYSEYFDNYWNKEDVTITNNAAISPEGVNNSTKLVENATNQRHRVYTYGTFTSGINYTFSVFVKKNSIDRFLLLNAASAFGARSVLNLDTLEITNIDGTSGKVENFSNGWYRFSISGQATTSSTLPIFVQLQNSATDLPYLGNGSSLYLYGAQLEAGSYPTSYIPNHGESGGVTRAADSCLGGGSASTFNNSEGVLYAEISAFSGTFRAISLSNNTNSNVVGLLYRPAVNEIWMQVRSNGVETNIFIYNVNQLQNNKIAIKYKENDFALWVNGVKEGTNNTGPTPVSLDELKFTRGDGNEIFYGNVKQVAVFNEALTDAELATLTTL